MEDLILYGNGDIADVMFYYFSNASKYKVAAFTCEKKYITSPLFNGLPVIPFEEVEISHPPAKYKMFIALGFVEMNTVRANRYIEAKRKGYEIVSFIHPQADIPGNVEYGENTIIMNNTIILPKVKMGSNIFVWQGTVIGHHSVIGDNCWFSSPTIISGNVIIGKNCFFGANSTLGHDISIGDFCFLGAHVLQVKNLVAEKVVITEPSKSLDISSLEFSKLFKF